MKPFEKGDHVCLTRGPNKLFALIISEGVYDRGQEQYVTVKIMGVMDPVIFNLSSWSIDFAVV